MKRILVFVAVGALIGAFAGILAGAWLGPGFLAWWASSPVQTSTINCNGEVEWAMRRLVQVQLYTALVGAIVVTAGASLIARALRSRRERKAAAAAASAPKP